jgi:hypothetical protein
MVWHNGKGNCMRCRMSLLTRQSAEGLQYHHTPAGRMGSVKVTWNRIHRYIRLFTVIHYSFIHPSVDPSIDTVRELGNPAKESTHTQESLLAHTSSGLEGISVPIELYVNPVVQFHFLFVKSCKHARPGKTSTRIGLIDEQTT